MQAETPASAIQQPYPVLRFGRSARERRDLGQEVPERRAPRRLSDIAAADRRAQIFCFAHNRRLAVLLDSVLVTLFAEHPWPDVSGPVIALCVDCSRAGEHTWYLDTAKLRRQRRERPRQVKLGIAELEPDTLRDLHREMHLGLLG